VLDKKEFGIKQPVVHKHFPSGTRGRGYGLEEGEGEEGGREEGGRDRNGG